jgi:hypothetical protein
MPLLTVAKVSPRAPSEVNMSISLTAFPPFLPFRPSCNPVYPLLQSIKGCTGSITEQSVSERAGAPDSFLTKLVEIDAVPFFPLPSRVDKRNVQALRHPL